MSAVTVKTLENTVISSHLYAVPTRKVVGTRTVLTQRGRLVLGLITTASVLAVLALVFAAFTPNASASTGDVSANTHIQIVEAGQTLWQIASEVDPSADPRETINRILDLNSLSNSAQIHAGQALIVPNLN
ncbi:MAG: LysM domain-containing protein [Actinobacteria bacterium]|nr:LysM domain-containing protein [Actinomycetota bacterium]